MIVLKVRRTPVDVDLGDLYPGFGVTLKPLTSIEMAEAREAAFRVISTMRAGLGALAEYGLDVDDVTGARLNVADQDQMLRVGHLIGSVEITMRAITAWSGITLAEGGGELAPIRRETLAVLLMDDRVERRLLGEIEKIARILVTEGNASGASRNGSSEPGQTASAPIIAATAEPVASPARTEGPAEPAGAVRSLN